MAKIIYATILMAIVFWVGCANNEIYSADYDDILENNVAENMANLAIQSNNTAYNTTTKSSNLPKTTSKGNPQKTHNLRDSHIRNSHTNLQKKPKKSAHDSHKNQLGDSQNLQNSAHDSRILNTNQTNNLDLHILNKSAPKEKFLFNPAKLNTPIPHLQTNCDAINLQQCEDLGQIYAIQEKHDLAVAYYKRACDSGKGSLMSCFFLSLMFANSGNMASAQEYLSMIDEHILQTKKIDEAELMLSISKISLIKEKLQNFCTNGESSSCKILSSVFKIRGELREAREFFSTKCKSGNNISCTILKDL